MNEWDKNENALAILFVHARFRTENLERKRRTETMKNEFTAIIEQDGDWFIAYCLEVPGRMVRAKLKRNPARVWLKPSRLSWRIVERTACVTCLRGLFKSEWFFREAEPIDPPSNAKNL